MSSKVIYNHFITYRGNKEELNPYIFNTFLKIQPILSDLKSKKSTFQALILAELAMVYNNPSLLSQLEPHKGTIAMAHSQLLFAIDNQRIKEYILDFFSLSKFNLGNEAQNDEGNLQANGTR